jgi:LuxR family maltose regulon positive regulatory protein
MPTFLKTKLHRPPRLSKRVERPRLIQRLDEGLAVGRRITLVSAPAGFGKTVCVSEWLDGLDLPIAWLSLDASDDDPVRFFAYFIAALQTMNEDIGREIEGVLRAGQLPPPEIISAALVNDILEMEKRSLLVLDDFHTIQDSSIMQVLGTLMANQPPTLHLVLITREDPSLPLARLRANNQMTEIRASDLRFSPQEADGFLREVIGLSLSQVDIAELEGKTEGWIIGLQLAGLSVRNRLNPSDFIAGLSGSHRFILSYLTEEVLNRQPEEIQQFLLETSILDKLNPDLCNAVSGRSDSRALLEGLFNANLFLIPLDDEGRWYRYHHLFGDLLRNLQDALQKDKTAKLHRRASRWYALAGGEGEAFVNEAIQHALAAEDYSMAVSLLEKHAMGMIMQGYAKTVNGWVQALPAEYSSQSPRTNLAFAWMHSLRGDYSQLSHYLELLEGAFSDPDMSERDRRSIKAEWLVMQSLFLIKEGKIKESLAMAREALDVVPGEESRVRSLAYFSQASAYQAMDRYDLAVNAYQKAIQYGRTSENSIAEMMSISGLAQLAFEHGQLHLAHEIAAPESARIEESGLFPPISTVVFGILGEVDYQWHQTEQARRFILRAFQLSTLGGYNSGMIGCRLLLSRLSRLEGDLEAAAREIQTAFDLMQADTPGYVRQEAVAQQVRVHLDQDRPDAAELALQGQGFSFRDQFSYPDLSPEHSISYSSGLLYNSSLCFLLYQARASHDPTGLKSGIELADRLISSTLENQSILIALEALLLRAQMHALLGDQSACQVDYAQALELGEPEGFVGVFIDQGAPVADALADLTSQNQLGANSLEHIKRILRAFPESRMPRDQHSAAENLGEGKPADLIDELTDRELDVLGLMAEGLKYKEIAARLYISLNTVRFHVKAIYGKLNVSNRTQAIAAARQLQIL